MPWKESGGVEEKMRFVLDHEKGLWTMTELCQCHGISRESGYETVRRFRKAGVAGLMERSRAPVHHPNQTAPEIVEQVLALRREHPTGGPKKLRSRLERKCAQRSWPALSTIGDWLKTEGLVAPRRKRRKTPPYTQPFVSLEGPNQVWCTDFKGWFRTSDKLRPRATPLAANLSGACADPRVRFRHAGSQHRSAWTFSLAGSADFAQRSFGRRARGTSADQPNARPRAAGSTLARVLTVN
jgi:hypothetical protein